MTDNQEAILSKLGYSGWTLEEIRRQERRARDEFAALEEQLTTTQRALDRAVGALKCISELSGDGIYSAIEEAREALASIKE